VGPPEEDIEFLRHFSRKILNPSLVGANENKVVLKENEENLNKNDPIVPSDPERLKARKSKRNDNDDMLLETEICKRSVVYDDDEESDEKKKKLNIKRKRVDESVKPKRVLVDFGPCVCPPYKARKVLTSKAPSKSLL
jgi:hypothetical protein